MSTRIYAQSKAFQRGLSRLIKPEWLSMFARHELQLLISGDDGGLDIDDLQQHATLHGFGRIRAGRVRAAASHHSAQRRTSALCGSGS